MLQSYWRNTILSLAIVATSSDIVAFQIKCAQGVIADMLYNIVQVPD